MKIKKISEIGGHQDGAIWNNYLFRFDSTGHCFVYDLSNSCAELCTFTLDKADVITPHSNAVMFGNEYYSSEDGFPILYTNIYNNYSGAENKLKVYALPTDYIKITTSFLQRLFR